MGKTQRRLVRKGNGYVSAKQLNSKNKQKSVQLTQKLVQSQLKNEGLVKKYFKNPGLAKHITNFITKKIQQTPNVFGKITQHFKNGAIKTSNKFKQALSNEGFNKTREALSKSFEQLKETGGKLAKKGKQTFNDISQSDVLKKTKGIIKSKIKKVTASKIKKVGGLAWEGVKKGANAIKSGAKILKSLKK